MASLVIATPIGPLTLLATPGTLAAIRWGDHGNTGDDAVLHDAAEQLCRYFAGTRERFALPLLPAATSFQQRSRTAMLAIPPGVTQSYGALAAGLGMTRGGGRAVGQACRRNPLPIVVPCHRVVAASGRDHYSGPGGADDLATKSWLLAHERAMMR